ncbi:MAG: F0F1 ATP synthase subunit alpha [PVC group bacterium]|nr:F0F1 ATP synthase subunit alpha [PVC group bacterium]
MQKQIQIPQVEIREVGRIKEITQGIVKADGLPSCLYGQLVEFNDGTKGVVIGFDPNEVFIIVLSDEPDIKIGDYLKSASELLAVPVSNKLLGRVVDCLAQPVDDKGSIPEVDRYPVFRQAPGIMERDPISEQLSTGIKIIDLTIPIGKGQRELIVGDRQTGRTSIAMDTMINQRDKDVVCIYCFIGGSQSTFEKIIHQLVQTDIMPTVVGVCSSASSSPAEQYIAPYTAAAIGEYFMHQGRDVVVVFDDLTKHAWAYRQISLLLERSPGREAYPGDIFFIHSQLLERAAKLKAELGGGTMSFLPIVETLQGDITGFIPSNLVSITDGQIFLNNNLFREGFKPAIDIGLSVSRLGSKVQCPALRELSEGIRLDYLQYREMLRLMRLRTGLSKEAQAIIRRGKVLEELFVQENYNPLALTAEVALFYAFKKKILEVLPPELWNKFKQEILPFLCKKYPDLVTAIENEKTLTDIVKTQLDVALIEYFKKKKAKT